MYHYDCFLFGRDIGISDPASDCGKCVRIGVDADWAFNEDHSSKGSRRSGRLFGRSYAGYVYSSYSERDYLLGFHKRYFIAAHGNHLHQYTSGSGGYRKGITVSCSKGEREKTMKEFIANSAFFGILLSLLGYELGLILKKKFKIALFNPLLIGSIFVIAVLLVFKIDYSSYENGAKYISYFLTPATVSLAVVLYRQLGLLKKYPLAIFGGTAAGVLTSMISILAMSLMFGLNHEQYVSLLPKSITTAIGMGISEKMNGIVTLTVIAICITGIFGNMMAEVFCKWFKIEEPIAKGLAIGTSSHAMGTAKAIEMGEIEGAMSSLSIVIAGIITVLGASVFANFL